MFPRGFSPKTTCPLLLLLLPKRNQAVKQNPYLTSKLIPQVSDSNPGMPRPFPFFACFVLFLLLAFSLLRLLFVCVFALHPVSLDANEVFARGSPTCIHSYIRRMWNEDRLHAIPVPTIDSATRGCPMEIDILSVLRG